MYCTMKTKIVRRSEDWELNEARSKRGPVDAVSGSISRLRYAASELRIHLPLADSRRCGYGSRLTADYTAQKTFGGVRFKSRF